MFRCLLSLTLLLGLAWSVSAYASSSKLKCATFPASYSDCNEWGAFFCEAQNGGGCKNCAGPGGLPRKTCFTVEYTSNCPHTSTGCGPSTYGNCQKTSGDD